MATNAHAKAYHDTRVLTAPPQELQLMLYDGALRWTGQARLALAAGDREAACGALERARRIVLYLMEGLRPEVAPELCSLVAAAYQFVYGRLVDAGLHASMETLDEAIGVLQGLRSTWADLLGEVHPQASSEPAAAGALQLTG